MLGASTERCLPAEGEGFEPPGTRVPRLFKSPAFGRSAIPPVVRNATRVLRSLIGPQVLHAGGLPKAARRF
jgi:hypothetical protein